MTTYEDQFDEDWTIVVVATEEKLKRFDGTGLRNHESMWQGVKTCDFSRWQDAVIATHYDGTVETLPLPGALARAYGAFLRWSDVWNTMFSRRDTLGGTSCCYGFATAPREKST